MKCKHIGATKWPSVGRAVHGTWCYCVRILVSCRKRGFNLSLLRAHMLAEQMLLFFVLLNQVRLVRQASASTKNRIVPIISAHTLADGRRCTERRSSGATRRSVKISPSHPVEFGGCLTTTPSAIGMHDLQLAAYILFLSRAPVTASFSLFENRLKKLLWATYSG